MSTEEKFWAFILTIIVVTVLGWITYEIVVLGPERWEFRWNNCLEDHLYDYCRMVLRPKA